MTATPGAPTIEDYLFAGDGVVPNNPRLPLIVYRGALETTAMPRQGVWRCSIEMVGPEPGRTGSMRIITITAARTRCSASPPVGSA